MTPESRGFYQHKLNTWLHKWVTKLLKVDTNSAASTQFSHIIHRILHQSLLKIEIFIVLEKDPIKINYNEESLM